MLLSILALLFNTVAVSPSELQLKIIGGYPTPIAERPFQVLLCLRVPEGMRPWCGGSIISSRAILTAAHCVAEKPVAELVVRAGSDHLQDLTGAQWFNVKSYAYHDQFEMAIMSYDIAVLFTDRKMEFGPTMQPIKLSTESPAPKTVGVVSGFGTVAEGIPGMSGILAAVSIPVLEHDVCEKLLVKINEYSEYRLVFRESHFCAANLKGGHDSCQGDSGGPFTIDDHLVGIVSWGPGCAREHSPAFYTDVAKFVPWINNILRDCQCISVARPINDIQ